MSSIPNIIRVIKAACTGNLIMAIVVVAGYMGYGLAAGLPMDKHFLNATPAHIGRGVGPEISAWEFIALIEAIVVIAFIFGRYTESNMRRHRLFCALVGLLSLGGLLINIPHVSYFADEETVSFVASRLDRVLTWYVWGSHLLYALVGTNND